MYTEIKPITNFNNVFADCYLVTNSDSDFERVWSVRNGKFLAPSYRSNGYVYFGLFKNGYSKQVQSHKLVATAFIPNDDPTNKTEPHHKNNVTTDNSPSNLEWKTHKDNCAEDEVRNGKISQANKKPIVCLETGEVFNSAKEAALALGIDRTSISNNLNGRYKTAGGYHWEFVA